MATITTESLSVPSKVVKVSLAAGETSAAVFTRDTCNVYCSPGGGGTMVAQLTYSLPSEVSAGSAVWFNWAAGSVATNTAAAVTNATAVRFTATTQPGVGGVRC